VPQPPGSLHQRFDLILLILWQAVHHVAELMLSAPLYRMVSTEDRVDRRPQRFRSIDHE
jgi:hypothetical protein